MTFNWDPSKTFSSILLSNGNETAETIVDLTDQATISNWSVSSGKWYWEIYMNDVGELTSFGICNSSFTSNERVGFGSNSWGFFDYLSSTLRKYHSTFTDFIDIGNFAGGTLMFALDMDNHKIWFGLNGSWLDSSDPATGTNPAFDDVNITGDIYACGSPRHIGDKFTAQFTYDVQTYSNPDGFSPLGGYSPSSSSSSYSSSSSTVYYNKLHFWQYILNTIGEPLRNVDVRFYLNDDPTTEANIFLSEDSTSHTTTSVADVKTDDNGFFEFWLGNEYEDGGYSFQQKFRLEWYKAGIIPGIIENINPWPNDLALENINSGIEKNKFVSNYLYNKWYNHLQDFVPNGTPHNLQPVDYESGCTNDDYNKIVSNKFLNDIILLSTASNSVSLSGSELIEYQENVTSWISSGGYYYKDITYSGFDGPEVTVQITKLSDLNKIEPKDIINIATNTTRIFLSEDINVLINIQGKSV